MIPEKPADADCLPPNVQDEDWRNGFSKAELDGDVIVTCIKTVEGDIGFLAIGPRDRGSFEPTGYKVYARIVVR